MRWTGRGGIGGEGFRCDGQGEGQGVRGKSVGRGDNGVRGQPMSRGRAACPAVARRERRRGWGQRADVAECRKISSLLTNQPKNVEIHR